jgi:hypothetical protein
MKATRRFGPAPLLSALIAILAGTASAGGLLIGDLYRDNMWVTSAWHGNDLITLAVAVPVLVAALVLCLRGSARAQLVWLGMLAYMLYGYAFYLFGAAFNRFFLIYAALFGLSIFAMVFALPGVDAVGISQRFRATTPVRWVGGYMVITALGLGGAWIAMSLTFVVTGRMPQPIVASDHPTGVVFALDLSLLVPGLMLAGVWLWRHRPWGYVLGVMMNVKGATYTLGLTVASVVAARAGVTGASAEIPIWLCLTLVNLTASALLLGHMQARAPDPGHPQPRTT